MRYYPWQTKTPAAQAAGVLVIPPVDTAKSAAFLALSKRLQGCARRFRRHICLRIRAGSLRRALRLIARLRRAAYSGTMH